MEISVPYDDAMNDENPFSFFRFIGASRTRVISPRPVSQQALRRDHEVVPGVHQRPAHGPLVEAHRGQRVHRRRRRLRRRAENPPFAIEPAGARAAGGTPTLLARGGPTLDPATNTLGAPVRSRPGSSHPNVAAKNARTSDGHQRRRENAFVCGRVFVRLARRRRDEGLESLAPSETTRASMFSGNHGARRRIEPNTPSVAGTKRDHRTDSAPVSPVNGES